MPDYRFAPRPGRFDICPVYTQSGIIGTGGLVLTANVTTQYRIPTPVTRCALLRLGFSSGVLAIDADGTVLATVNRRDNVGAANIALTAAHSLKVDAQVANKVNAIALLRATDAQIAALTFQVGDQLYVDIVNNSAAIDTQPTHSAYVAEWAILE